MIDEVCLPFLQVGPHGPNRGLRVPPLEGVQDLPVLLEGLLKHIHRRGQTIETAMEDPIASDVLLESTAPAGPSNFAMKLLVEIDPTSDPIRVVECIRQGISHSTKPAQG